MKVNDMARLKEPFPAKDIEWRLQSCGSNSRGVWAICLAYITSRAVQDRLDEVCGPDGWKTTIKKDGDAYLCELSIRVTHDDGQVEWISRVDGADSTDIEAVKGGISGAIKRAAVQFGIGRYLYNLEEGFATILSEDSKEKGYNGKTKDGTKFKWIPPKLPDWALPQESPEVQESIQTLEEWISTGVLTGDNLRKAKFYINTKDIEGMKRTIAWCENQKTA